MFDVCQAWPQDPLCREVEDLSAPLGEWSNSLVTLNKIHR
jgi:hypothetical protein